MKMKMKMKKTRTDKNGVALSLGLGLHETEHERATHPGSSTTNVVGLPLATNCGTTTTTMHTALVLFVHGVDKSPVHCTGSVTTKSQRMAFATSMAWKARNQYWYWLVNKRTRPPWRVCYPA